MDWKKYLKQTPFKKDTDRIVNVFRVYKINSYQDLQSLPTKIGSRIGDHDTYQVVAALNQVLAAEKSSDLPPIEEAVVASAAKEPKAEVKTGQPKKAPARKQTGDSARSGASDTKTKKAAPAKAKSAAKAAPAEKVDK